MIPDIIRENSISGGYTRRRDGVECRWTVWYNPLFRRYEAYTRGDSKSPCDVGWYNTDRENARYFQTQEAALEYLSKIVPQEVV